MNIDNLNQLAERLEELPVERFNMAEWDCGSAACIGGWTEKWWPEASNAYAALDLLAATCNEDGSFTIGEQLFYPSAYKNCGITTEAQTESIYNSATPQQAAKVVRHLVETGKVDWSIVL